MNSFWNSNLNLFRERFPALAANLKAEPDKGIILETAKNGSVTAKSGSLMLHSKYNPEREAEAIAETFEPAKHEYAIFLGFGLGYAPIALAKKNPDATIILIEKDSSRFFSALTDVDWTPIFTHQKIIIVLEAEVEEAAAVISKCKADNTKIFRTKAQVSHNENYFQAIENTLSQNAKKEEINTNTLEKFAKLWLSNSCRNLDYLNLFDGVKKYSGLGKDIPFVILAAGPSLQRILPSLSEIKKRAMIVCVDTALHACLKQKVEPDFIILTDPQYYASMHLEFLSSPTSVLITEIAAYPSVLRFKCKETVLYSSMFPIGQFFEAKTGDKGKLAAGGSVTTSAWDFARLCGSTKIFMAGMDLGFPGKETHIRGSRFEEKAHSASTRTGNAESQSVATLFSASPSISKDYDGKTILTDKRMSLFSWWFENQCTNARKTGTETYSLTTESLAIKGIEPFRLEDFLSMEIIDGRKKIFMEESEKNTTEASASKEEFELIKKQFAENLNELESIAKKGIEAANRAIKDRTKMQQSLAKLSEIDSLIMNSKAKDAASLVFPTKRQLEKFAAHIPHTTEWEKTVYPIQYSKLIYTQLLSSVKLFQKFF